jgi:hypothetical protein
LRWHGSGRNGRTNRGFVRVVDKGRQRLRTISLSRGGLKIAVWILVTGSPVNRLKTRLHRPLLRDLNRLLGRRVNRLHIGNFRTNSRRHWMRWSGLRSSRQEGDRRMLRWRIWSTSGTANKGKFHPCRVICCRCRRCRLLSALRGTMRRGSLHRSTVLFQNGVRGWKFNQRYRRKLNRSRWLQRQRHRSCLRVNRGNRILPFIRQIPQKQHLIGAQLIQPRHILRLVLPRSKFPGLQPLNSILDLILPIIPFAGKIPRRRSRAPLLFPLLGFVQHNTVRRAEMTRKIRRTKMPPRIDINLTTQKQRGMFPATRQMATILGRRSPTIDTKHHILVRHTRPHDK